MSHGGGLSSLKVGLKHVLLMVAACFKFKFAKLNIGQPLRLSLADERKPYQVYISLVSYSGPCGASLLFFVLAVKVFFVGTLSDYFDTNL